MPRTSRLLIVGLCSMTVVFIVVLLGEATPVLADGQDGELDDPGVDDLEEVIDNVRNWVMGLLIALATLLLTIGGVRYVLAGGDPGEVSRSKDTLKYAALGFAVAILAPVLVEILRGFVGAD